MSPLALILCLATPQVQDEIPPLGTNLAAFSHGSTQWPLVNVFKMAAPWTSPNGQPVEVDAHGNVKSLKEGQYAVTAIYTNGHYPKGTYTLTWKGTGEFEANGPDKLTADGIGKALLEVSSTDQIVLRLKSIDSKDPVRDVRLVMPGYEETAESEPFHPVFLQRMSLYRVLRFAEWQAIRTTNQKEWADRTQLDDSSYTLGKGAPYELMIDLANTKAAMPWFCVPRQASDDYVRQMATLIKERLKPELKVAIEFADGAFQLNGELPQDDAKLQAYAERSQQVFAIFENVFGGKARLVRILGTSTDAKAVNTVLGWKRTASQADALAVQPWFGVEPAQNLDKWFDDVKAGISGPIRDKMFELYGIAQRHGLRLFSSGGGALLTPQSGTPLSQLMRDPRMAESYTAFLKNWRTAGGTLFIHSSDCGLLPFESGDVENKYKPAGAGAIEYQDQDPQSSMVNRALIQYALFPDR